MPQLCLSLKKTNVIPLEVEKDNTKHQTTDKRRPYGQGVVVVLLSYCLSSPLHTALKRHTGGRVLVFVVGAFAEMPEDVSRICDITAHDLARTHA